MEILIALGLIIFCAVLAWITTLEKKKDYQDVSATICPYCAAEIKADTYKCEKCGLLLNVF